MNQHNYISKINFKASPYGENVPQSVGKQSPVGENVPTDGGILSLIGGCVPTTIDILSLIGENVPISCDSNSPIDTQFYQLSLQKIIFTNLI